MAYGSMPFTHCYANRYKNRDVTCLNGTPEEAGPFITSGCKSAKSFSEMMVQVRADPAMDAYLVKNGWAFKAFTDTNFKSAYESLTSLFPVTSTYLSKSQSQLSKSYKCSQVKSAFRALENTVCFRTVPLIQDQVSRMQVLMILSTIAALFTFLSERLVNTTFEESFGNERRQFKNFNREKDFQQVPQEEKDFGQELAKLPLPAAANQIEMQDLPPADDPHQAEKHQSGILKDRTENRILQLDYRLPATTNQPEEFQQASQHAPFRPDSFYDARIPAPEN